MAILSYNSAYPDYKFDGIHLDIEFNSETYSPWDIDHPGASDDYVGLLTGLKNYSPNGESMRSQGMTLGIATEHWWSNHYGHSLASHRFYVWAFASCLVNDENDRANAHT